MRHKKFFQFFLLLSILSLINVRFAEQTVTAMFTEPTGEILTGNTTDQETSPATNIADTGISETAYPDNDSDTADLSVLNFPILFVKQHNYQGLHIYDTFYQWRPGGGIYLLENPADPQEEHRIRPIIDPTTPETLGEGIYFDPSLSWDAKKILFCFKGSPGGNSMIYEIGVDGKGLRQITSFDFDANPYFGSGNGWHDIRPAYLPDGRIVFTSTRYSGLVPCANNGVALLHVMNADGSDVHTISVNNVTEFDPSLLDDGRILFGRWEYIDKNALTIQSLWTVMPDGTNETALFANNMVFPEAILQAKQVPGCPDLIVGTFAAHNGPPRGSIAMIDVSGDKNDENAIFNFEYPECPTFDRGQSCDPWALNEHIVLYSGIIGDKLPTEKPTDPSVPERIGAVLPQPEGVYNSILLTDRQGRRIEVLRDPEIDLHSPIPLVARPTPRHLSESTDRSQKTGKFYVNNVYRGLKNVEPGTVRWLRVIEETSRVSASPGTTNLNQTFSISAALAWSPKNYLGIVPVKEDGSVYFEAPAGRAVYFQLLDKNYRLVRSMRTFIQAAPGVTRSCVGCHEYGPPELSETGAVYYPKDAAERLQDESWGSGYLDYPSQIQPILNQKCVSCHGGAQLAAGLDLSDGPTRLFNISYENLTSRRHNQYQVDLIAGVCCMNGTAYYSCKFFEPYEHGSGKAPLADLLLNDPVHRDLLTPMERELMFAWIDSNGLYFGTWDYTASGPVLQPWENARQELIKIMLEPESGCAECHANSTGIVQRFENDWINLNHPEMSRILRAPLKKTENDSSSADPNVSGLQLCRRRPFHHQFLRLGIMSGGQYEHAVKELKMFPTQEWIPQDESGDPVCVFESTENPTYQKMLAVIRTAQSQILTNPRIDMPNASEAPGGIVTGHARQIIPQPIPEQPITFHATVASDGIIQLNWERSARTIGLVFELHRSDTPHFDPDATTLLTETERFCFDDITATPGKHYYAIIPVSDFSRTCGTCRIQNPKNCRQDFSATRGKPTFLEVDVPEPTCPQPPENPTARSDFEAVSLAWEKSDSLPNTRYLIYRQEKTSADFDESKTTLLTNQPVYGEHFRDRTGTPDVEYLYAIKAISRKKIESEPVFTNGKSKPLPRAEIFAAPLNNSFDATVRSGQDESQWSEKTVSGEPVGHPAFQNNAVLFQNDYLVYPGSPEFNARERFALELDVYFNEPGNMPVVVGFGNWNRSGWFLQKLNGKWRFHFGQTDCDAKQETPLHQWLHLVAAFDGERLTITQNGEIVAEQICRPNLIPWSGSLYLGQYSAAQSADFQFSGQIRNVHLYNYVP